MKVKISYSVDLDEVPDKAKQLLYDVKQNLLLSSEMVPEFEGTDLHGDKYLKFKETIDKTRRKLFIVDSKLEDVVTILDDWKRASLALEIESLGATQQKVGGENVESSE
tara:strand:+ start:1400 stop:1726 length:327 start_codon:yes stop_codon:yes gene_type:complete